MKAEERYPVRARVLYAPSRVGGTKWLVVTPTGHRRRYFTWSMALAYAFKSVEKERALLTAKRRAAFPRSNKAW